MPTEGRMSARRAAIKRQRALGSQDTKAAMKVLERYCKKKYRQSVIFAGIGSQLGLAEPHSLAQENVDDGHYHSEPFTPHSTATDRQFLFASTAFSCPPETKNGIHDGPLPYTFDFGEHDFKEEIKYHKGQETWSSYIWRVFKFLYDYLGIQHFLLLFLMILYALAGGYMFYSIESPAEILRDEERENNTISRSANYSRKLLEMIYLRCDLPQNPRVFGDKFDASLQSCSDEIATLFTKHDTELRDVYGLSAAWKWDFWNAVFYSGTIFTTIGYGNISCRTMHGRIATCAYALFGVPLMLVVLNSMGKGLFLSVQTFWEYMRRTVRRNFRCLRKNLRMKRSMTLESVDSEDLLGYPPDSDAEESDDSNEQDLFTTFPMSLALLTVFLYISLCSWLFCYWEDWDYSTAFYFFFISLSTVGLGDEMPNHPKRACAFFLFFIVGLALVSMCISILQVKVENKYMAALQLIDQEHQNTIAHEDQEEMRDDMREQPPSPLHSVDHSITGRPDRFNGMPLSSFAGSHTNGNPNYRDHSIRWRQREDSRGSELSSQLDRISSQIYMSSPSESSPICPPPVLGVFMARSIRRPHSILVRSNSNGSQSSRRTRPVSMAKSQEDILSQASPMNRTTDVESPTGTQRAASPLASPRQAASLAVITEDIDEDQVSQPPSRAPSTKTGKKIQVPVVRIEDVDELEEKEKEESSVHSSLSSLSIENHRL